VTSQISVAANHGSVSWDDLSWERSYDGMKAYSSSKVAFGLVGLELDRLSRTYGWGISSNLSHPGVAPTNLLAARPDLGRTRDTFGRRLIRVLSDRGILVRTVDSAQLPALLAATGLSPSPACSTDQAGRDTSAARQPKQKGLAVGEELVRREGIEPPTR